MIATGYHSAMLRGMELRHMRYFVAVAEALSFTKAAEKLRLAQPSLTRQVRNLEDEIGVRLLDRIAQTEPFARDVVRRISPVCDLDDDDLRAFRDLSRELARDAATPAARDTLRDFDRFLDDVAARRLDRHEAFRRLAALQQLSTGLGPITLHR